MLDKIQALLRDIAQDRPRLCVGLTRGANEVLKQNEPVPCLVTDLVIKVANEGVQYSIPNNCAKLAERLKFRTLGREGFKGVCRRGLGKSGATEKRSRPAYWC